VVAEQVAFTTLRISEQRGNFLNYSQAESVSQANLRRVVAKDDDRVGRTRDKSQVFLVFIQELGKKLKVAGSAGVMVSVEWVKVLIAVRIN
jgi:hypothetical protein